MYINQITKSEKTVITALIAIMLVIPLSHYYCVYNYLPASAMARAIYGVSLLCLMSVVYSLFSKYKIRFQLPELLFGTLVLLRFASYYFSPDRLTALKGASGRNEGLIMLLCYYLIFFTTRFVVSDKGKNIIINTFLGICTVHSIYGLCQFFDAGPRFIFDSYHYAISGVTGNPNFMGSLMVIALGISAGMFLYFPDKVKKLIYFVITLLFAAVLVLTRTMSAYVGAAAMGVVFIILVDLEIKKRKGTKIALFSLFIVFVLAVVLVIVADKILYGLISKEIGNSLNQLYVFITTGYADESFASGRLVIWKNAIGIAPDYLLTGVGIDCFEAAYTQNAGMLMGRFVDKAHNELLQILVTMGLPAMLCYIAIYATVLTDLLKKFKNEKNKYLNAALILAFCGYIVQAMFNISVMDVAPYFWIVMGLMARPLVTDSSK
ncbi:MAG: O-antigen ligase family protein [Oscillospiraceae bacterium]|nr:O-antigen ligase family protein [Oscillospiraceae bacterium]